jgi:excinuclease UvrABC ATPase subunit
MHAECPQLRDGEPKATGRHCPLDVDDSDDSWLDDEGECDRCKGDGCDPMTDYLLPCPACQGEQR